MYIKFESHDSHKRPTSWHILRTWTRVPGRAISICGLDGQAEGADDFGNDKTCERCLRINAKNQE